MTCVLSKTERRSIGRCSGFFCLLLVRHYTSYGAMTERGLMPPSFGANRSLFFSNKRGTTVERGSSRNRAGKFVNLCRPRRHMCRFHVFFSQKKRIKKSFFYTTSLLLLCCWQDPCKWIPLVICIFFHYLSSFPFTILQEIEALEKWMILRASSAVRRH